MWGAKRTTSFSRRLSSVWTWTAMVREMQASIEQTMPETNLNAYQRLSLPASVALS